MTGTMTAAEVEAAEGGTAEVVTEVPTTHRRRRFALMAAGLSVAIVLVVVVSLGLGQYWLTPAQVIGVLLQSLGIDTSWAPEAPTAASTSAAVIVPVTTPAPGWRSTPARRRHVRAPG